MPKWLWIAGWLFALPASALAQQADAPRPPAATQDVVVIGDPNRVRREKVLVEALAVPSLSGQLARFVDGVCPISFGLGKQDAARLARRMRRVAHAAGLPVAGERCRPNAVVFVVPDRARAINHWRRRRPDFFAGLTPRQISALAKRDGPVAAWQVVEVKGPDGRSIGRASSDHYDYLVIPEAKPSRLGSQIRIEFFGSFVLVEQAAIGDASIVQLADYAAMRTFANTDPRAAAAQPLPTILSLFSRPGEPVPLSVTHWDLRYLKALYDARLASRAGDQQREMARSVKRDAAKAGDAAD